MLIRAGRLLVSVNKSVRKPRACLTRRSDGPIRMMRTILKMVGENGRAISLFVTMSKISPI